MAIITRRQFVAGVGGAVAWPLAVRGQQAMPVIGLLHPGSPDWATREMIAFRNGLSETGYVEGRNVTIEYRWARNDNARLPTLAADLVRQQVAVIVAPIATATVLAAKAATSSIPIVFSAGVDPVAAGIVPSLSHPGGNVTGVNYMQNELGSKRMSLLHEIAPRAVRFGLLVNPTNPVPAEASIKDVRAAAQTIAVSVEVARASTSPEIEAAFTTFGQKRSEALVVTPDPFFFERRVQLATLATRHLLPAIYGQREYVDAGGLMSYGPNQLLRFREVGIYTGRVLHGEKPADMPVAQPTAFDFAINLPTAHAIGTAVSPSLLAQATEVIE
jgi:putative ABC transport system substrate-binding protein